MAESDESWASSKEQSDSSEEHSEDEGTSSDTDSEVKHLRFPYSSAPKWVRFNRPGSV